MKKLCIIILSLIFVLGCSNIMEKEPLSETGTIEIYTESSGKLYKAKEFIANITPEEKYVIENVKTGIHHYYMVYGDHLETKDIFIRAKETSKIYFDLVDRTGQLAFKSLYNGTLLVNDRDFGDFEANEEVLFEKIPSGKVEITLNFGNRKMQKDIVIVKGETFYLDLDENPVSKGLLARWEFDENPKDISGNGNIGVENGNIQYLRGKYGKAVTFDENSWIEVDFSQISSKIDNELSISMWIKLDSLTGNNGFIFSTSNGESIGQNFITNKNYNGFTYTPTFEIPEEDIDEKDQKKNPNLLFYTNIEKWTHIVLLYNKKEISAFVNGKLERKVSNSNDFLKLENEILSIGSDFGKRNSTFFGLIDNLRIYNRVLESNEINKLFNE